MNLMHNFHHFFGGRIAEEIIYGKDNITTGAGNDIQQATNLARRMVKSLVFLTNLVL